MGKTRKLPPPECSQQKVENFCRKTAQNSKKNRLFHRIHRPYYEYTYREYVLFLSERTDKAMKIVVSKTALLEKLIPAMGTVSNKNTITSIEGVLIETMPEGRIRISTYDMNKGVRAMFDAISVEEEGKYIINAQRFFQTVRVLPEDEITIEINDRLNCTITSGKASFSMFAMNGSDFPNLPELTTDRGFEIPSLLLRRVIGKVSHSIAEQDNRAFLCGAFFNIRPDEMEVVSCDSYTLSKCNIKCEIAALGNSEDNHYSFILPGHALNELNKILPDDEESSVKVYLSRKHAIIRLPDIVFFTRTIDVEYMDYNRVLPKDNSIFVTINRERLLDGLERANLIAEEKIQGSGKSYVKISVRDQSNISVSCLQYLTSSNGILSTGAPVTIIPSYCSDASSSKLR